MANFPTNNAAFPGTGIDSRSVFITRTYTHLVAGILGFILVELGLFESGLAPQIARFMFSFNWLLILGAFMLTGWLASRTAQTSTSIGMQYFAYAVYVVAEALIFVPLEQHIVCVIFGLGGTAVHAAEIAAVGYRDAEVRNLSPELIGEGHCELDAKPAAHASASSSSRCASASAEAISSDKPA